MAGSTTPVDVRPEPLESLRRRYPLALEHVHDSTAIRDHRATPPSKIPACHFVHEDGLRLIVSRERWPGGRVVIHVIASFPEDCELAANFRVLYALGWNAYTVFAGWLNSIPRRFAALSGDARPLVYLGLSDAKVPHWMIEEEAQPCTCAPTPTSRP
jgi:hypothetical protein